MCVCVSEITFLSHLMAVEGIKLLFQKVKAIDRFLLPKNLKTLRVFFGMVNYYRRFISNCTDTTQTLNALLSQTKT